MKYSLPRLAAGLSLALLLCTSASAAQKKLLVVTAAQGFRHSSIPLAEKVLAGLGEQSGLYTVDYARGGADGKGTQDMQKLSLESVSYTHLRAHETPEH